MNFPNFTFWSLMLKTVGVEVCCVVALGSAAQLAFRRAVWQRAIWQTTVICMLLVSASEWSGFGRGMVWFLVGPQREAHNAPPSGFMRAKPELLVQLWPPASYRASAALKPAVWWPGWIWLAGTVVVLGRMAAAQSLLLALRLRREKIADGSLQERVRRIGQTVGLRRTVCLLRLPRSISPMAFGFLWPTVGLPPGFEERFSAPEQEAILAHELAHLAAMDPLWFWAADFASAVLWWHPLAWWVRRSLHVSSELAADEATALVPDGPGSLAKCLVALGREMTAGRGWGWVGINGGFRSKLGKRVERLTRMTGNPNRPLAGWTDALARIAMTILIVPTVVLLVGAFQTAQGESENGWRQSWNNSPGALLMLAALDNPPSKKEQVAARIQNAKLLYELGKLDESEAVFVGVMKDDPSNRTAPYYLDLIKEAQFRNRARARSGPITPIPLATNNLVYTGKMRQEILSKLDRIHVDEVQYDLPLTEVLKKLTALSQKIDPDGKGINFFIAISQIDTSGNVPVGAIPVDRPAPAMDISTVQIKIPQPLRNLRLSDVLNAIALVADQPIKYTVEDYGVAFSPKPAEAPTLYSKVFHVDPTTFVQNLRITIGTNFTPKTSVQGAGYEMDDGHRRADDGHDSLGGPASSSFRIVSPLRTNATLLLDQMVRAYFTASGVNLTEPGKSVFFNDRLGLLLVRATAQDLETIEKGVEQLTQMPPQVSISTEFVDLSLQDGIALGFNSFLQGNRTNVTAIMSDTQFQAAINAIEHKTGKDILGASPKGTTLSYQKMHLSSSATGNGVTLDIVPRVWPDGFSIEAEATATVTKDDLTWQAATLQELRDGETLVLGGALTNPPPDARKLRLVFITLRIIDAAGNALHDDEEISKRR